MKKLVNNAIVAAMVIAATMVNTVNAFATEMVAPTNIDTLEGGISPEGEDAVVEEDALEVENWMMEDIFKSTEETLEVENWMTEDVYKNSEEVLEVENWMTEDIYSNAEETLNVEAWMSDSIYTSEAELELEAWMFQN